MSGIAKNMRLIVHDFAGHPFQVQLSRALAEQGHAVLHLHAAHFATPHGALECRSGDAATLQLEAIDLGRAFDKYGLLRRRRDEAAYGRLLAQRIAEFRPDCVLSANTPLGAQWRALRAARGSGARFVPWLQDLLSVGIGNAMRRKVPMAGRAVAWHYANLEGRLLRQSDAVVVISEDFRPALRAWGVMDQRVHVIENWAPLDELPPTQKQNAWSREHQLAGRFCFLYSGTLGLKHRPDLLIRLAEEFRTEPDVRVVIVSEGIGADWLRDKIDELGLDNVLVYPFQPYERLPEVLGAADVLVAVLEEAAAAFSVPSKVLSYLCTGRPILGSIPLQNLAARRIAQAHAGLVVAPADTAGFVSAARALHASAPRRAELAAGGRRYAESAFSIEPIRASFEQVLKATTAHRVSGILAPS